MPLYEYQCDSCGVRFERIQKFSDPLVSVCPTCGGHVQKLISSPAFQFKGSGFYITDYGRKGEGSGSKESSGDSKDSKDSSGAKDSKDSKETKESKDSQGSKDSKESKSSSDSGSSSEAKSGSPSSTTSTPPKV